MLLPQTEASNGAPYNTETSVCSVLSLMVLSHLLTVLLANAVARIDNLEFLSDVVPKTMTLKNAKAIIQQESQEAEKPSVTGPEEADSSNANGRQSSSDGDDEMEIDAQTNSATTLGQQHIGLQIRSPRANGVPPLTDKDVLLGQTDK